MINIDNAVFITDGQGLVTWANDGATGLAGRAAAALVGRPLTELLREAEIDPALAGRITKAIAGKEPLKIGDLPLRFAGRQVRLRFEVQPLFHPSGAVGHFLAIGTDLTLPSQVEQQLQHADNEAAEAARTKSAFLATMSHEIRTPMNGVIGMTSLLLGTALTAEQRDYVNTIRTSGDTLLAIINEMLDFARIESGRLELEVQTFDVSRCVEDVIDLFAERAAAREIELAYFVTPEVPRRAAGDHARLHQILANLVGNAVKFTPRGFVTVTVTVAASSGDRTPGDTRLEFEVADSGIGIPPERIGMLFKPFSQVDSSNARAYGGTGLGLAVCSRLCQLMGGAIEVTSVLGQGSRFRFSVVVKSAEHDRRGESTRPPIPASAAVLAVADLAVNRAVLRGSLLAWGISPLIAATAAEAVQLAQTSPLAAAVIDQSLRSGPAGDLISHLRETRPHLPIVLLTSAGDRSPQSAPQDATVFRVPKPLKPAALYEAMQHAIVGLAAAGPDPGGSRAAVVRLADTIPLDILLVEDNPVNQKVALRFLQRLGYRADAVANGREAVQATRQRDYKLVFMDVQMPEMDGFAATREIRGLLPKARQPVIIALTANAMQGDREKCLESGMDDFITKPVRIDEIEHMIRRFFAPGAPANAP